MKLCMWEEISETTGAYLAYLARLAWSFLSRHDCRVEDCTATLVVDLVLSVHQK